MRYLEDLREITRREGCSVHAYLLMTNHVHLLMTPTARGQIAKVMQALGRKYVRYVNNRYCRTGTLWEGRYKSCLIDSDTYLLRCYRYIELNPIRARMVSHPGKYAWSSYASNGMGKENALVHPHPSYLALGSTRMECCAPYRELVAEALSADDLDHIRLHLQRQHAIGSEPFCTAIAAQLARRVGPAKIGRPRRSLPTMDRALCPVLVSDFSH
jgi:putative transposase